MIIAATKERDSVLERKIVELERKVGNTPLIEVNAGLLSIDNCQLSINNNQRDVQIFAKQEWLQIGGSVKARAAYSIIRNAIETGQLTRDKTLLDATSGNTGIAYAAIAKEIGLKVALCLPENASIERKQILTDLGVHIIFTSPLEGTDGAQEKAQELARLHPEKYFYADQYKNDNNWKAHYHTTAVEIFKQVPNITHFVAGLGTTGTFIGTARRLRELNPSIKMISFQPDSALHGMEGWKHLETAVVPTIYDPAVADQNIEITTEEAYATLKKVYELDGLLLSPSSAANIAGAIKVASSMDKGVIVTVLPDNADKYSEVIKKLIKK